MDIFCNAKYCINNKDGRCNEPSGSIAISRNYNGITLDKGVEYKFLCEQYEESQ